MSTPPAPSRPAIREGFIAGVIGAAAVALWFFVLDLAGGRLLFTPAALGSAFFMGATSPDEVSYGAGIIAGYTLLHVVAFAGLGVVAALLFAAAERHPPALLGAAVLFVTLEVFFIGMIAILATWLFDVIPWWTIAVANLLAGLVMGTYLWREHPALHQEIRRHDLEGSVS